MQTKRQKQLKQLQVTQDKDDAKKMYCLIILQGSHPIPPQESLKSLCGFIFQNQSFILHQLPFHPLELNRLFSVSVLLRLIKVNDGSLQKAAHM